MPSPEVRVKDLADDLKLVSKGKKDINVLKHFGIKLIRATTYQWQQIEVRSRAREVSSLAKYAIIEQAWIDHFRPKLFKTRVALFRERLREGIVKTTDPVTRKGQKVWEWNFYDGLKANNLEELRDLEGKTVSERMTQLEAQRSKRLQLQEIRKIITTIESASVSQFNPKEEPARTEDNVHEAMRKLVHVRALK
jgi:hypothetical protein